MRNMGVAANNGGGVMRWWRWEWRRDGDDDGGGLVGCGCWREGGEKWRVAASGSRGIEYIGVTQTSATLTQARSTASSWQY
ncbi:hypothetical protein Tco_0971436 [Tanacetum coccineum]